jgi:uncharacterized protein involved in exopolysaccharide biosynthesis
MEDEANLISMRDALLVVVRQRRLILTIYAGVMAIAIVSIFLLGPQYRAAAKVLLTTNRADISSSAERATALVRTSQVSQAEVNSQIEILRSRDLVRTVLTDLGTPKEDEAPAPSGFTGVLTSIVSAPRGLARVAYRALHDLTEAPADPLYSEVTRVIESLEVTVLKGSNVIELAITGPDPEWGRNFINRLTAAYIERQAEMQQVTQAEDFFMRQSEILRRKLADSETALRQLRERAGTLAGQHAELHERLNEFSAELARTKIARAEQGGRVNFLARLQTKTGGNIATPELLALEAKRAELAGRYRADSERVRDVDQQIVALRRAIASYDSVTASGGAGSGLDLVSARAALTALEAKEAALARERDEYRRQAELLDAQSFDLVRLERQVKLDEEAYLSYVRTAEESRLSNALEASKILRLSVIEPATRPMEPVGPLRGRILAFALVGGLAVSVGIGFAREYFDTTLKTAADIRRYGNLDVLAVLPERT